MLKPVPVTLSGRFVRLEPLTLAHVPALWEIADDPTLWRFGLWPMDSEENIRAYVTEALDLQERGSVVPFVQLEAGSGRIVGSTRYLNIEVPHWRLEIGATWLGRPWQRTAINTEAKLLLLTHAFEQLQCVRVEFRADSRNTQSRAALERIGAVYEGALRRHMLTKDGVHRDTVYYSVIAEEWPAVKAGLKAKLR